MLLILDIGNTNIKSALFDDDRMIDFTVHSDTNKLFHYFSELYFTATAICSVNPPVENEVAEYLLARNIKLFRTNIKDKLNLKINYDTPETLGMDRVCSAAGALEIATRGKLQLDNRYLITIDFGTATTINIVSPSREFIGGLIAPGLTTMLKSLNEKTAQLPLPDLRNYKGLIGNTTHSSIVSGVINSTIGMINETINHLSFASSQNLPIVFATGGNVNCILPHLNHKFQFEEALVLKGLKVIYDLNKV